MDRLYERFQDVPFSKSLQESVAANGVSFVNIRLNRVYGSGKGLVEKPVVQREKRVCGKTWNKSYPVNLSGFFEPRFGATVNSRVYFI